MTLFEIPLRRLAVVLATIAVAAVVAACGSSSSSSTTNAASSSGASTTASGSRFNRTAFAVCLKKHGVTLPSRPAGAGGGPPGGGFFGGGGGAGAGSGSGSGAGAGSGSGSGRGGFFRNNPKFAAAFRACGGGNFRPRNGGRFRISHAAVQKYVACIRQHGYPQMPNPNFSGKGPVFPASIRRNSKFLSASRSCQSILVPARPGGAGGTTANPSS